MRRSNTFSFSGRNVKPKPNHKLFGLWLTLKSHGPWSHGGGVISVGSFGMGLWVCFITK